MQEELIKESQKATKEISKHEEIVREIAGARREVKVKR
jgi:hypothetical protein